MHMLKMNLDKHIKKQIKINILNFFKDGIQYNYHIGQFIQKNQKNQKILEEI